MEKTIAKLWEQARKYNELSNVYSEIADQYVKLTQELEDEN